MAAQTSWTCSTCHEEVPHDFELCWNCGADRSGTPDPSFERAVAFHPQCRSCGYVLLGLRENRCPECGRPFDPDDPSQLDTRQALPDGGESPVAFTIEPLRRGEAMLLKDVRLRALSDAPKAFGSTYAKESNFSDADWSERCGKWCGGNSITWIAKAGPRACGIAAAFLDQDEPSRAHLVSMWVDPAHRRKKIGKSLLDAVARWAKARQVRTLLLMVTGGNDPAIHFYERLGFARTGRSEPYPNDPALLEYEMAKDIT